MSANLGGILVPSMGAALKSFRACGIRLALSGRGTLIVDE